MKLERWLPFKFQRKHSKQQKTPVPNKENENSVTPRGDFYTTPMRRFFDEMFSDPWFGKTGTRDLDRWFGDFSPNHFPMNVEVSDQGANLCVTAELPGMSKDDIQLQIEDDMLVIRGEKKHEAETEESGVFRTERYFGHVERTVPLPRDLDHDKADAHFAKGVLKVQFPKTAGVEDTAKAIPVK